MSTTAPAFPYNDRDDKDKKSTIYAGEEAIGSVDTTEVNQVDEKENRELLLKIDWHLMPLLCFVYGLQFLDKACLSYASIMGFRQDRALNLSEYSWLSSIFYLGYLVGEFPTSYLLQRLPLSKWTAFNIFVWGAILCCMAVAPSFASLMVVRFFLGLFESTITPAFTLVTSQWYRKNEQGTRLGIWFSFNFLSQILGACMAYGLAIANQSGKLSIPGWKVMFIFLGALTAACGVILAIFLPDSPLNARFLRPDEREMAVERIRGNQQGIGNKEFKLYQVKEAFTDPLTWLYAVYAITTMIPNGGLTNFFAILVQSFGFSATESLLYTAPAGAVTLICVVSCLYLGDRFKKRILFGIAFLVIGIFGTLLIWLLPSQYKVGRLIGYYISAALPPGFVVILSLIASNVAGHTKKLTVAAIFLVAYCVGNLIGPQTFRQKDAPRYDPALATVVACCSFAVVLLCIIWFLNVRENRRRAAIVSAAGYVIPPDQAFADLTDRENEAFFYTC